MIRRPPRSTRVRSSAASDVYKRQDKDNPPSYFRCKLTTDVTAMKHWLVAEIRAGGVLANLWLLSHVRIFTDFNTSHATRPRIVFRSKESEPAPGRLAWHVAYSATCSTPPTRPHALFHYNDVIDVTVRSTRTDDIDDGNERMIGAKIESGQGPTDLRVSALKARIRASFSAPTTSWIRGRWSAWYPGVTGGRGSGCLLYTSPSPRDVEESRMPSSA